MQMKYLCCADKSIKKQIMFTECVYDEQSPRKALLAEHV